MDFLSLLAVIIIVVPFQAIVLICLLWAKNKYENYERVILSNMSELSKNNYSPGSSNKQNMFSPVTTNIVSVNVTKPTQPDREIYLLKYTLEALEDFRLSDKKEIFPKLYQHVRKLYNHM